MTQIRRGVAVVAAVLVLLACLQGVLVAAEEAKKLYPACGGYEHTATARAQEESTLFSYYGALTAINVDCLAYEVTSVRGGQTDKTKDYCLIEHQTEYAYALLLRATYTDDNYNVVTRDFSIRDMTGGSLTEVTARMPRPSTFSIIFKNLASSERCNLRIRALLSASQAPSANASGIVPTVVAIEPRTVYTKDAPRTYVVLDHGSGQSPSRADVVTLVDYTLGTCASPAGDTVTMDYTSTMPASVHTPGDAGAYSVRVATLYNPNTYRVCYRGEGASSSVEVAVITAFSGNPAYYEVISGEDSDGRVMVGDEAVIKFYGYDLDTRPKGDAAKFVWFTEECDSGSPAAGVPLSEDLGPADNYGPNTTYALWTWTMTEAGAFKVCYRRKATGTWTEVPSIEDVGPGTETDDSTPTAVPTPTDPSTGEDCPKLTYNAKKPWKKFKSIQVTLTTKNIPDDFYTKLMKMLCLPKKMFLMVQSRKTSKGYMSVFVTLNCDEEENKGVCDTTERLNYFAQISSTILAENGISAVEGSTSMFSFGEDDRINEVKRSSSVLVFCSLCVLAGGGMAVFAVSRYQERRHHFNQFGLEEEDIDDMYDFGAAPAPDAPGTATRDHYNVPGAAPQPPARIQNAVIEIED